MGYTLIADPILGAGVKGVDTGRVRLYVWAKDLAAAAGATHFSQISADPVLAGRIAFRKSDAASLWQVDLIGQGTDDIAGIDFNPDIFDQAEFLDGDMVLALRGTAGNTAANGHNLLHGINSYPMVERHDLASTAGADAGISTATVLPPALSIARIGYTTTLSSSTGSLGGAVLIRIREVAPVAPSAPNNLTVISASPTSLKLDWAAPTTGTAPFTYSIYRDGSATPLATTSSLTYTDVGLVTGQPRSYQVSASNSVGEGPKTASVTATPTKLTFTNSFETGLASGTAITAANSGNGSAGRPFDSVFVTGAGTAVYDTAVIRAGSSRSAKISTESGAGGTVSWSAASADFAAETVHRMYFQLDAMPFAIEQTGPSVELFRIFGLNDLLETVQAAVSFDDAGVLRVDTSTSAANTVTSGVWYRLELRLSAAAGLEAFLYDGEGATPIATVVAAGFNAMVSVSDINFKAQTTTDNIVMINTYLDDVGSTDGTVLLGPTGTPPEPPASASFAAFGIPL